MWRHCSTIAQVTVPDCLFQKRQTQREHVKHSTKVRKTTLSNMHAKVSGM